MLTKADDYPIHQTSEPIAFAGTDRNYYDRYFFNGYSLTGDLFFAAGLGVYPHLNIMDAAFSVVHKGVQHNVHASRYLNMERLDTQVGPIRVEVVTPLEVLRLHVNDAENGIKADLTYHCRTRPLKEPRFTYREGPRTVMDITRMTQNGTYEGWIEVAGERIEITRDRYFGTRDRSWGVRPIGLSDPQPLAPAKPPQFYWLWSPLNFDDRISLYHLNDDAQGRSWNTNAVICGIGDGEPEEMFKCRSEIDFKSGSRHAKAARLFFTHENGSETRIDLTPQWQFYMTGIGYGNPDWAHGLNKGELATGYDSFRTNEIKGYMPPHLHIQAFVTAEMHLPDGSTKQGAGILEQLIVGPHAPSGFQDILDPAK